MMNANKILYDYIVERYGDAIEFANKNGLPHIDLNAVLLKDNVQDEICIGLNLFKILNIDAAEFIFNNKIKEAADIKNARDSGKNSKDITHKKDSVNVNEIYSKCVRLSENEKKKVLDYMNELSADMNKL